MFDEYKNIDNIKIVGSVLVGTRDWLYQAGKSQSEAFVLWAGSFISGKSFLITTAIFPEQQCLRSSTGLAVYVSGKELFNVNKWLFENKLVLIAQVHSHPTNAYHSTTDDLFPMVNSQGQFSIVVPFFSRSPKIELSECAIYRLSRNRWVRLEKISNVFEVI